MTSDKDLSRNYCEVPGPVGQGVYHKPHKLKKFKHFGRFLFYLLVFVDITALIFSFITAYNLWLILGPILAIDMYEKLAFSRYSLLFGVAFLTLIIGFEVNDLYRPQRSIFNIREFQLLLKTWLLACAITLVILFMADELYFNRGIFVITWITLLVFLFLERYAFFKFSSWLRSCGIAQTTIIIYGTGSVAQQLLHKFNQSPKLGYYAAGFVDDAPSSQIIMGTPVLGGLGTLKDVLNQTGAEKLFIALPQLSSEKVISILNICRSTGCKFQIVPSIYESILQKVKLDEFEGIPLVGIQEPKLTGGRKLAKRCFDICLSFIFLVLLAPIIIAFFFILKLSGQRHVFESLEVAGEQGHPFYLNYFTGSYLLRPQGAILDYSARGGIVAFLDAAGLSYYPQLWNVLTGEMSMVGPQISLPGDYEDADEVARQKYNVKPGLTGLWQMAPNDEFSIFKDKDLNIYYIHNQSVLLDVFILLRVLLQVKSRLSGRWGTKGTNQDRV